MNQAEVERCCPRFGKCEFQKVSEYTKLKPETPRYVFENLPFIKDDPLFERNTNLCVGCTRCIRALKRFVSERHSDFWKKHLKAVTPTGKKVAVLGSGPAGLTAAYYLARKSHEVTIFEQSSQAGGMLRHAISRKRLPKEALEDDIQEILKAGVDLKLNSPQMRIDELFEQGFHAVFLGIGTTFVGPTVQWLKEEGLELTEQGSIKADPVTLATGKEGVFAGGDAVLGGITEDFVLSAMKTASGKDFYTLVVDQVALHRGDSSRSAISDPSLLVERQRNRSTNILAAMETSLRLSLLSRK